MSRINQKIVGAHSIVALVGLLGWLLFTMSAQAEQANAAEPQIQATLEGQGPFWLGQQVALSVTLLTPGYFDSAVSFELPDPDGVLLMPPSGHPVVGNETIDDTLFVTQQYDLRLWPMKAGEQSIPAFTVRFSYKKNPLDQDSVPVSLASTPIPVNVESPPGTEGMGTVISARNLTVTETWKPEPGAGAINMGAALTRTLTFSAPDVPGMIFPPFPAADIDGLGVYSKRNVQDEDDSRGSLVGKRQDVITYIAKRSGQFTIPAVEFRWFDLDSKTLQTQHFPLYTLNVNPSSAMASSADLAATAGNGIAVSSHLGSQARRWWIALVVLVVLIMASLVFINGVRDYLWQMFQPLQPTHLRPLYPGSSVGKINP